MDYLSEQLKKCYLEHNTSDYCKDIILLFELSHENYSAYKYDNNKYMGFYKHYKNNSIKMKNILNKHNLNYDYNLNSVGFIVNIKSNKEIY